MQQGLFPFPSCQRPSGGLVPARVVPRRILRTESYSRSRVFVRLCLSWQHFMCTSTKIPRGEYGLAYEGQLTPEVSNLQTA
jgi:hypothetical protein